MKKIYIHIGCHKTGSTSIQHFFFKNKNILLKNNIYIPKQKNPFDYTINHSDIAMELLKENNAEDIKIIAGGIIPDQEIPKWKKIGIDAIFGPGDIQIDNIFMNFRYLLMIS